MVDGQSRFLSSFIINGKRFLNYSRSVFLLKISASLSKQQSSLASSVAVERVFSKGRLLISHVRNRLSAQSTRALLCLGYWSKLDIVKLDDLKAAASLPDVKKDEEWSDDDNWSIVVQQCYLLVTSTDIILNPYPYPRIAYPYPYPCLNPSKSIPVVHGYGFGRIRVWMT